MEWNTVDELNPPSCPFCFFPLVWDGQHDCCPNFDCDFIRFTTPEEHSALCPPDYSLSFFISDDQLSLALDWDDLLGS